MGPGPPRRSERRRAARRARRTRRGRRRRLRTAAVRGMAGTATPGRRASASRIRPDAAARTAWWPALAALRSAGLDVPLAVVTDPRGGEARLRRTAWREEDLAPLLARADATPGLHDRWAAAEEASNVAFAAHLDVLTDDEQAELAELIHAADEASRSQPEPTVS